MMMTLTVSSQSITKDSVRISKPVFKSIIKESRKCDSLRSAFENKSILINSLIENNLSMFEDFQEERADKKKAIAEREKAEKELRNFDKKRWGLGFSAGYYFTSDLNFQPAIGVSINYSVFRF